MLAQLIHVLARLIKLEFPQWMIFFFLKNTILKHIIHETKIDIVRSSANENRLFCMLVKWVLIMLNGDDRRHHY